MGSETSRIFMRTLYLQKQGSTLQKNGERFLVRWNQQTLLEVPACNVEQICLLGNIQVSTAVIQFCLNRNIPIHFLSWGGKHQGVLRRSAESNWKIHRSQIHLYEDDTVRLAFAKRIVHNKIGNGTAFLSQHLRNHPETKSLKLVIHYLKHLNRRLAFAENVKQVLGIEGVAARHYFKGFGQCIRSDEFLFHGRQKHPPTDPVNSLLSFGYTLLTHRIDGALTVHGIDSTIGLLHESRGQPALACDLIEEFRVPIVDAMVLRMLNQGMIRPEDFYQDEGSSSSCLLQDASRKKFLLAFEKKLGGTRIHPDSNDPVDWRRIIDLQVHRLKQFLQGKTKEYVPLEMK